jgi:hypothetical protein
LTTIPGVSKVFALVLLVVAVAAVVVVADVTVPSSAAVVNGASITRPALDQDLAAIASSQRYQCYLRVQGLFQTGQSPLPVNGVGVGSPNTALGYSAPNPSTYSSSFAGSWLNQMIDAEVLAQANARRHIVITPYDLVHGRVALEAFMTHWLGVGAQNGTNCGTSATAVLQTLPQFFVNQLVLRQANEFAFVFAARGTTLSPTTVAAYFAAHRHAFDTVCVAVLPVSSKAEATQVSAAVAKGTSFATLAQQNGGGEDCGAPALSPYVAAAARLQPGQLTAPLANGQQGYLILQLLSRHPSKLSVMVDSIIQAIAAQDGNAGATLVEAVQRESHVAVDPRYGHWVAAPVFTVVPPSSPAPTTVLCAPANDPLATVNVCPAPHVTHPTNATGAG